MPRKKKLEEKQTIHGKQAPTRLSQIWGEDDDRYSSYDATGYQEYIGSLNKTDLYNHCIKCGIKPTNNVSRALTEKKLMSAFYKYHQEFQGSQDKQAKDLDLIKKVERILNS